MFAEKRVRPLSICNFGFWDNIKLFLKKKNINGSVEKTLKKYIAQVN